MRPILFLDTNTIWHRRLAEALSRRVPAIAINSKTGIIPRVSSGDMDGLKVIDVTLPRGWASSTALVGQSILRRVVERTAKRFETEPMILLASPAYLPLAKSLRGRFPLISYTADDYRSYEGWGGERLVAIERRMQAISDFAVFVSDALRDRAVEEYDLASDLTLVCPNATEPRFADRNCTKPPQLENLSRPIVGILGGLSERLNLDLVSQVAASPLVGTLLVAGSVERSLAIRFPILESEKVFCSGYLPHSEMHLYAAAMDAAIIPYANTQLNYYCSPMRLYDHLATGVPIVATDGCDQINKSDFANLFVASPDEFVQRTERALSERLRRPHIASNDLFWSSRADLLLDAAGKIWK